MNEGEVASARSQVLCGELGKSTTDKLNGGKCAWGKGQILRDMDVEDLRVEVENSF